MKRKEDVFREEKPQNQERCPLPERLRHLLDVPGDLMCGGCYIEMRGQSELMLQGCRKIAVYTEEEIVLLLRRGCVSVRGRHLMCVSYHADKIEIRGWVTGVNFSDTEGLA